MRTSTLIYPQKKYVEILCTPDSAGNIVSPQSFNGDVQNFFQGRPIIAIETYDNIDIAFSPINPTVKIIDTSILNLFTLTLLRLDGEEGDFYKDIPLCAFKRTLNPTGSAQPLAMDIWRMNPSRISWPDSFVRTGKNTNVTDPFAIPFLITHLLQDQDPTLYFSTRIKHKHA